MTEKRFVYKVFDIVDFKPEEFKLYEIDNNPSDDLDESNLFYVYSTSKANIEHLVERLNELSDENKQLKYEMGELGTAHAEEINNIEDKFDEEILKLEKENKQLKSDLNDCKKLIGVIFDKIMDWDKSTENFLKENGGW